MRAFLELLLENKNKPKLAIVHNLSVGSLQHSFDILLGDLPNPSLAIIKATDEFNDFGECTLILDPKNFEYRYMTIYDADVYSARMPEMKYRLNDYYDVFGPWEKKYPEMKKISTRGGDYDKESLENGGISKLYKSIPLAYVYLREKGIKFNNPKVTLTKQEEDKLTLMKKYGLEKITNAGDYYSDKDKLENFHLYQRESNEIRMKNLDKTEESMIDYFSKEYPVDIETVKEKYSAYDTKYVASIAEKFNKKNSINWKEFSSVFKRKIKTKNQKEAFHEWINQNFDELFHDRVFFDGRSPSGKPKYKPYNIQELVKKMSGRVRNKEGFTYGVGNIRAAATKTIGYLEDTLKKADNLVSKEEMEKYKKWSSDELDNLISDFDKFNPHRNSRNPLSSTSDGVVDVLTGADSFHSRFPDAPRELIQDALNFRKKLSKAPTEYFEVKCKDRLDLNIFSKILVPKKFPEELKEKLEAKKIEVIPYTSSRKNKLARMTDMFI